MKPIVFLGGTCNGSTWREKIIPLLKVDYFNPIVDTWDDEAQQREVYHREHDDVLLYALTPKMVGMYSIAEAMEDANEKPSKVVVCFLKEDDGVKFTDHQWKSAKQTVKLFKQNGVAVFTSIKETAEYINTTWSSIE